MKRVQSYIKNRIYGMCSFSEKRCEQLSKNMILATLMAFFSFTYIMLRLCILCKMDILFMAEVIILSFTISLCEIPRKLIRISERKIEDGMIRFIVHINHKYQSCKNIRLVLKEMPEDFEEEIINIADIFRKLLDDGNGKEKIFEMIRNKGINVYVRHLFVQVYVVSEYGNLLCENGTSLFLSNLEKMRTIIMKDILYRKKKEFELTGYSFVTVAAFFMMPLLKVAGCLLSERMYSFYDGTGRFVEALCFIATFVIYLVIKLYREGVIWQKGSEEQMRGIRNVVIFEKDLPEMNVMRLLKDLASLTDGFSEVFERCFLSFSFGYKDALKRLRKEGIMINRDFEEVADAFDAIDDVGISNAFAGIESDIQMHEKTAELEGNIRLEKRKNKAGIITLLPSVIAMGFYFILPFAWYTIENVTDMMGVINSVCR